MKRFQRTRPSNEGSRGQILPLFAISLVAILGLMGLGLDAAQTFLERRDAQGAADLAALSAARLLPNDPTGAITQAKAVGVLNGYAANDVHVTTPYQGSPSKIRVDIDSKTDMFFMPVLGIHELDVDAGAAAVAEGAAASCSFCSLNGTDKNHTLLLKNGATLRVDGDIIVNSENGGTGPACEIKDWEVCGDGFDIFGDPVSPPAYISAKSITVAGGWETHDENVVMADGPVWPDYSTLPPTYKACPSINPNPALQPSTQPANVCIHAPKIVDPLNNPAFPSAIVPAPASSDYAVPTSANCSAGTRFPSSDPNNSVALNVVADATLCPGLYYGGVKILGGTTTLLPGFYYMAGKNGLKVQANASLDGTAGVTIYSSATLGGPSVFILPNPDLAAPINTNNAVPTVTKMESSRNPVSIGDEVEYKFEVKKADGGPNLNGVLRVFDGDTELTGSTAKCQPVQVDDEDKEDVKCKITYTSSGIGTHGISAVFISTDTCGDTTCYTNVQAVLDPVQIVVGSTDTAGDIEITTTGNVQLTSPDGGRYKGIVLFQDRSSDGSIELSYGSGKAACSPISEITVNGVTGPEWSLQADPPVPCGALGGISGTIYAAHQDSIITTTVSGSANIQIISGRMLIDSSATTRFAFDGSLFAGNSLALFE